MNVHPAIINFRQFASSANVMLDTRHSSNRVYGLDIARLRKFVEHSTVWKKDTKTTSSALEMAAHPSYRAIVEMGSDVVPLILDDLQEAPHHWFIALSEITKENPVLEEDRGRVKKMTKAWLDWGKRNKFL